MREKRITGIVQFYLLDKGYGYVRVIESKEEFYFSKKDLQHPVKKGDSVDFVVKKDKQGLYATNINLI